MVHAPFNFVSNPNLIFFPDWADSISQDIPFEDGYSGSIGIRITAETPIFIRNGHSKDDALNKNEEYASFCHMPDGRFFIPATSLKGAVREVLEILSYGKMAVDPQSKFAQREFNNSTLYTIKSPREQAFIFGGWLRIDGDGYVIDECENIYRVSMREIDRYFNTGNKLRDYFSDQNHTNLNGLVRINGSEYSPKTAVFKYKLMEQAGVGLEELSGVRYSEDDFLNGNLPPQARKKVRLGHGNNTGTIVFSGSPSRAKNWEGNRHPNDGKFWEFVFDDNRVRSIKLSESEFKHYEFIYSGSDDWKFAKKRIKSGKGVPVFFRKDNDGNIKDFGLAFLYKLPYSRTPLEIEKMRARNYDKRPDMAECIFGYVGKQDFEDSDTMLGKALRGRVQFQNCICTQGVQDRPYTLILNGPKASYYPIYIKQDHQNGVVAQYQTYNDGQLSGWKRYVMRNEVFERNMNNLNLDTVINPLKKGAVFEGTIAFHNLRAVELGALLSALTFHNYSSCRHQLGQAKPFGFGKVKVEIVSLNTIPNSPDASPIDQIIAMGVFEKTMNAKQPGWISSYTIQQLFALSSIPVDNTGTFDYMSLTLGGGNEFVDAKGGANGRGAKYALKSFDKIVGSTVIPQSLISPENREQIDIAEVKVQSVRPADTNVVSDVEKNIDKCISFAKSLMDNNCWNDAKISLDQIIDNARQIKYRVEEILSMLEQCKSKLCVGGSLSDCLSSMTVTSSGQLFGFIKKTVKNGTAVGPDDVPAIAEKCIEMIGKAAVKQRDQWKDEKKWKPLAEALQSEELKHAVFEIVASKI